MKDNVKKIPTYKKANLTNRFIAHIIDAAIMVGGMFLFYVPGIVYAFIKDGLMNGQSIGKKMMGIMVINVDTNEPCSILNSAGRQLPMLILSAIIGIISMKSNGEDNVGIVIVFIGISILILDIVLISGEKGMTIKDFLSGTQVINVADYIPNEGSEVKSNTKKNINTPIGSVMDYMNASVSSVQHHLSKKANDIGNKSNIQLTINNLTNYNWTLLNNTAYQEITYIFRKNGELLVSKDGNIERCQYEFIIDNNSILITDKDKTEIYNVLVLQDDFFMLNKYSSEEILYFANKTKFQNFVKEEILRQAERSRNGEDEVIEEEVVIKSPIIEEPQNIKEEEQVASITQDKEEQKEQKEQGGNIYGDMGCIWFIVMLLLSLVLFIFYNVSKDKEDSDFTKEEIVYNEEDDIYESAVEGAAEVVEGVAEENNIEVGVINDYEGEAHTCYFSRNKSDYESDKYIFIIEDLNDVAIMEINGRREYFRNNGENWENDTYIINFGLGLRVVEEDEYDSVMEGTIYISHRSIEQFSITPINIYGVCVGC